MLVVLACCFSWEGQYFVTLVSYFSWQHLGKARIPKEEATSSVFILQGLKRVDSLLGKVCYLHQSHQGVCSRPLDSLCFEVHPHRSQLWLSTPLCRGFAQGGGKRCGWWHHMVHMVEGKSPRCWFWHSGPIRTSVVRCIIRIHSFSFLLVISLGSVEIRLKPRNSSSRVHVGDEVAWNCFVFMFILEVYTFCGWSTQECRHPSELSGQPYAARSVNDRAPNWANSSKITSRRDGVLMCPLEDCHFFILVGTLGTFFGWMHSAPKGASSIFLFSRNDFSNHGFLYPPQNYPKLSCLLPAEDFQLSRGNNTMWWLCCWAGRFFRRVTIWDVCKRLLNA